jgi:4-diphosphocytidyl-2-C-methyl-D-erythritol kinase
MVDSHRASRVAFPNAKVNLGLQVRERRADGFHRLDSLFVPVPWCDTLELVTPGTASGCTLHLHGDPVEGHATDNLIHKAWTLLADRHGLPAVDFHLIKSIPSGAGLGGGSADGAFALSLLNAHFELGLSTAELEALAAQLGSDCPFFICNTPARVTGRGEHIAPIDLRLTGWHIVLLNPGIHIPTAAAFGWVTPNDARPGLGTMAGSGPEDWDGQLLNDFTSLAAERHPIIGDALRTLRDSGATFADMSGSGSTVFGFFREAPSPTLTTGLPSGWRSWTGRFPD